MNTLKTKPWQRTVGGSPPKASRAVPRPPKEPDTSTYNGRVAKRLREVRTNRGLAVSELKSLLEARGVKVNRSLVYDWENGSKLIHPNYYPAIADALGYKTVRAFLPAE